VLSDEALIGMRVRVSKSLLSAGLRGLEGTITGRWGSPHYLALDVLLDDGGTQLFWHHDWKRSRESPRAGGCGGGAPLPSTTWTMTTPT
jgi:hypothetical protein